MDPVRHQEVAVISRPQHRLCAAAIGCLMLCAARDAVAQRTEGATRNGPGWGPHRQQMEGLNATAAEKAYAIAKLDAIERILLKVPEIANPDFRIWSHYRGFFASAPKPNTILQYYLQLVV